MSLFARRLRQAAGAIIGLLTIGVIWAAVDLYRYAQIDEAQPADAAIVLGAGVFGSQPSPVLRERINHAILLYNAGHVDIIIFTGGRGAADQLTEAEVAAAYAVQQGIPAEAILLEDQSTTTLENLTFAQQIAADHNLDSFLIVSTPFHMRRAMLMAEGLGMEAYSSPTRSTRWISFFTKSRAFVREVLVYVNFLVRG